MKKNKFRFLLLDRSRTKRSLSKVHSQKVSDNAQSHFELNCLQNEEEEENIQNCLFNVRKKWCTYKKQL